MKAKILFFFIVIIILSCSSNDMHIDDGSENNAPNQVLMLKVDYTTNAFEGGTIIGFSKQADNFTVASEYVEPGDFGSIKLTYKELGQPLFAGTIIWMGLGKMTFPEKLEPANSFEHVRTDDLRYPKGFEVVFNFDSRELDYDKAWLSVQGLVKVREFLAANSSQKAKIFLYTPSIGVGNPKDWYWVIYLKK